MIEFECEWRGVEGIEFDNASRLDCECSKFRALDFERLRFQDPLAAGRFRCHTCRWHDLRCSPREALRVRREEMTATTEGLLELWSARRIESLVHGSRIVEIAHFINWKFLQLYHLVLR